MTPAGSAKSSTPAVRHEALLGIMVITILVFALGFLIYHKMDLKQRQLAAIASPESGEGTTTAGTGENDNTARSVAAFEEFTGGLAAAGHGNQDPVSHSATEQLTEPAFSGLTSDSSEDSESPSMADTETQQELVIQNFPPGDAVQGTSEPGFDTAAAAAVIDDSSTQSTTISTAESDNAEPGISFASVPEESGAGTPDFPMSIESAPDPGATDFVPGGSDVLASAVAGEMSDDQTKDSLPAFELAQPDPEMEITPSAGQPDRDVQNLSESTDTATSEPVLLAMAEPDSGPGAAAGLFDGSPVAETSDTSTERPDSGDPGTTVRDVVEPFPSLDGSEVAGPGERLLASQETTPFGSGFQAVTQPSQRPGKGNRNSIRTAAGSGADGKFSLSAFNYQNNSAEPAPDDGTTYDSVIVQDGDNYTKISKRVYGAGRYFSALAVFNQHRIADPSKMRPGMVVLTPPREVLEERYPQLFEGSKPKVVEPAAFLVLDDGSLACRVGERETLSDIAEKYLGRSSRWIEIYRLNQTLVNDPNKLKAGLILALPDDAVEVRVTP